MEATNDMTCRGCGAPLELVTERWPLELKRRCRKCPTILPLFTDNQRDT